MAEAARPALYALLDMARVPQLYWSLAELERQGAARCLFEGATAESVRRAAPFIVAVDRAPEVMARWAASGAGQSWGVLMEAPLPLTAARRHVRRFLQVRLPDGSGPVMMRLWDPRVLGPVLAHSNSDQMAQLLPAGIAFFVERDEASFTRYAAAGCSVMTTVVGWPSRAQAA